MVSEAYESESLDAELDDELCWRFLTWILSAGAGLVFGLIELSFRLVSEGLVLVSCKRLRSRLLLAITGLWVVILGCFELSISDFSIALI